MVQQAQEIFRDANKLTRSEKQLIIGFMAGNRGARPTDCISMKNRFIAENPCAHLGDVITVRLSEEQACEQLPGSVVPVPVIVETFFQMNFANGQWKKLRKVRALTASSSATN